MSSACTATIGAVMIDSPEGDSALILIPLTRSQAGAYIREVHRHHGPPQGFKFAIGVRRGDQLVGVATAGRPVARLYDDGLTIEITRVATDGTQNACSMLYGACWRAAKAMGYRRAITYTRADEPGTSLRAAGWRRAAELAARSGWGRPSRPRKRNGSEDTARVRWEQLAAHAELLS